MDSYGCTPRSAKTGSRRSGRHRRSPMAARQEPAPCGLAAARAIASQDRTAVRKTDPLRRRPGGPAGGAPDTPAGGEHCFPVLGVSADGGAWPPGAARAGPHRYTPASRSGTHGRSCSRRRRAARTAGSDAGAGPELRAQASPPPALGGWTNAARLCEAPTVKGWASGRVFGAGRGTTRKPRRQTGVFVSLPSSAKHTPRAPLPPPAALRAG
jgi:hypothetical protein